jgi:sugar/nucleoside kinase (ribokinase family)
VADQRRVVVSANEPETRALATALGVDEAGSGLDLDGSSVHVDGPSFDPSGEAFYPAPVRDALGVDAVVLHDEEHAVAATDGSAVRVPNLTVEETVARTGAGDRFTAGLACALAADWEWHPALALANVCASYRVATGGTADPDRIRSFL